MKVTQTALFDTKVDDPDFQYVKDRARVGAIRTWENAREPVTYTHPVEGDVRLFGSGIEATVRPPQPDTKELRLLTGNLEWDTQILDILHRTPQPSTATDYRSLFGDLRRHAHVDTRKIRSYGIDSLGDAHIRMKAAGRGEYLTLYGREYTPDETVIP